MLVSTKFKPSCSRRFAATHSTADTSALLRHAARTSREAAVAQNMLKYEKSVFRSTLAIAV